MIRALTLFVPLVLVLVPGVAARATGDQEGSPSDEVVPVVKARLVEGVGNRHVRSVRRLIDGAGRMAWSRQGDELAFEAPSERGRRQISIDRFDGAGPTCVTCELYELRDADVLDPVWHPSGEYLLVQVREHRKRFAPSPLELASPHRGLRSELWLVDRRGRNAWKLTNVWATGGAITVGGFSAEADRLAWSEREASSPEPWGSWVVRVADFSLRRGQPSLSGLKKVEVPDGAYAQVQGFSPDDQALLVTTWGRGLATPWRVPLREGELESVVRADDEHDAVVRVAPRSDHVALTSDRGLAVGEGRGAADVWIQRLDGSGRERWTYFNDPESDHWIEGGAVLDDLSWHPDGERLAIHLVSREGEALWEIELAPDWTEPGS